MIAARKSQPESEGTSIEGAIKKARGHLLELQRPDGHWEGELFVDATLCCDYIIYMHWSGQVDEILQEKCAAHIRSRQLPES